MFYLGVRPLPENMRSPESDLEFHFLHGANAGVFFCIALVGAVPANASSGKRPVFLQHVTAGRVGNHRPTIGDNVALYPGATATRDAVVGNNSVIAVGTGVDGVVVPDDWIASSFNRGLSLKPRTRDHSAPYYG